MKANAPDKIYINDFGSELSYDWHTEHCCESDIEYVRTDAFIEKADNYLRNNCQRFILTEKDIEDFKNYMKGE